MFWMSLDQLDSINKKDEETFDFNDCRNFS